MSFARGLTLVLVTIVICCGVTFAQDAAPAAPAADAAVAPAAPAADAAPAAPAEPAKEELTVGTTLENLQAAFEGESNARERYLAFAAKAEEEKYLQVARLFKAAARSEEIHAATRAKLIESLGGKPDPKLQKPEVKSTKENLEVAIKGETFESEKMYPAYAAKAEEEKQDKPAKIFKGSAIVEGNHAKMYQDALANLEAMKEAKTEYLVCTVCGETTTDMGLKKCPVCDAPREKFETIK
ncbi:MAG: rubrerythrin family protein [Candidatus Riflebacteria bacterium]|nr:rubrerythrin family protein [Candidatus Riflebacteria bacterium]